jgi:ribosomal protein L37AE/L43A
VRSGLARFKAGIWKLRGMRKLLAEGSYHLYSKEEDAKAIKMLRMEETEETPPEQETADS